MIYEPEHISKRPPLLPTNSASKITLHQQWYNCVVLWIAIEVHECPSSHSWLVFIAKHRQKPGTDSRVDTLHTETETGPPKSTGNGWWEAQGKRGGRKEADVQDGYRKIRGGRKKDVGR